MPDTPSAAAEEGTAAHEMAERILLGTDGATLVGQRAENGVEFTDDMLGFVMRYVDLVRSLRDSLGASLFVEVRVPIDHLTGELGATGTADCILDAGDELIVVDLKYGRGVEVAAEDNTQMVMYASGAMRRIDELLELFDEVRWPARQRIKRVRMLIAQPRLGAYPEWCIPVLGEGKSLCNLEDGLRWAASASRDPEAKLVPSEKACRWCKAAAHCPALAAQIETVTGVSFADLTEPKPPGGSINAGALGVKMQFVDSIEGWCKQVRAETERRLLSGATVPGYKLVQGRKGARRWTDADAVETAIGGMRPEASSALHVSSLVTPPTVDKLVKAGEITKEEAAALQALIVQPEGGLSVAPESDKRPAVNPAATDADFSDATLQPIV